MDINSEHRIIIIQLKCYDISRLLCSILVNKLWNWAKISDAVHAGLQYTYPNTIHSVIVLESVGNERD